MNVFDLPATGWALPLDGMFRAVSADSSPDFQNVYSVIRSNLVGITDDELNRATVNGLLRELDRRVALVPGAGRQRIDQPRAGEPIPAVRGQLRLSAHYRCE